MSVTIDEKVVEMRFDYEQFKKGAGQTIKTIGQLEEAIDKAARKDFDALSDAVSKVDLSPISNGIQEIEKRTSAMGIVTKRVFENLTDSAYGFATGALSKLTSGIRFAENAIIQGGLNRAKGLEDARFTLRSLFKDDMAKVEAVMQNVDSAVKDTRFALNEAAGAAAQFASSGMQAGEEMENALKSVTAVASLTNSSYGEIANIFTGISGAGRVMGDDLLQLSSRGMNAAASLAEFFNMVNSGAAETKDIMPEVRQEIMALSEGAKMTEQNIRDIISDHNKNISFKTFASAMNVMYAKAAFKANETVKGVTDNIRSALAKIGAAFFEPIIKQNGPLVTMLNTVREKINLIRDALIKSNDDNAYAFVPKLVKIAEKLISMVNDFVSNIDVREVMLNFYNGVRAIEDVLGTIVSIIGPLFKAFRDVFINENLRLGVSSFTESLVNIAAALRLSDDASNNLYKSFKGAFDGIATVVGTVLRLIGSLTKPLPKLIHAFQNLLDIFLLITGTVGKVISKFTDVISESEGVSEGLSGIENGLDAIISIFEETTSVIKGWFDAFRHSDYAKLAILGLYEIHKLLTTDIFTSIDGIANAFSWLGSQILNFIPNIAIGAITGIAGGLYLLYDAVTSLFSPEVDEEINASAMGSMGGMLDEADKELNIFDRNLKKWSLGDKMYKAFVEKMKGITSFLSSVKDKIKEKFSGIVNITNDSFKEVDSSKTSPFMQFINNLKEKVKGIADAFRNFDILHPLKSLGRLLSAFTFGTEWWNKFVSEWNKGFIYAIGFLKDTFGKIVSTIGGFISWFGMIVKTNINISPQAIVSLLLGIQMVKLIGKMVSILDAISKVSFSNELSSILWDIDYTIKSLRNLARTAQAFMVAKTVQALVTALSVLALTTAAIVTVISLLPVDTTVMFKAAVSMGILFLALGVTLGILGAIPNKMGIANAAMSLAGIVLSIGVVIAALGVIFSNKDIGLYSTRKIKLLEALFKGLERIIVYVTVLSVAASAISKILSITGTGFVTNIQTFIGIAILLISVTNAFKQVFDMDMSAFEGMDKKLKAYWNLIAGVGFLLAILSISSFGTSAAAISWPSLIAVGALLKAVIKSLSMLYELELPPEEEMKKKNVIMNYIIVGLGLIVAEMAVASKIAGVGIGLGLGLLTSVFALYAIIGAVMFITILPSIDIAGLKKLSDWFVIFTGFLFVVAAANKFAGKNFGLGLALIGASVAIIGVISAMYLVSMMPISQIKKSLQALFPIFAGLMLMFMGLGDTNIGAAVRTMGAISSLVIAMTVSIIALTFFDFEKVRNSVLALSGIFIAFGVMMKLAQRTLVLMNVNAWLAIIAVIGLIAAVIASILILQNFNLQQIFGVVSAISGIFIVLGLTLNKILTIPIGNLKRILVPLFFSLALIAAITGVLWDLKDVPPANLIASALALCVMLEMMIVKISQLGNLYISSDPLKVFSFVVIFIGVLVSAAASLIMLNNLNIPTLIASVLSLSVLITILGHLMITLATTEITTDVMKMFKVLQATVIMLVSVVASLLVLQLIGNLGKLAATVIAVSIVLYELMEIIWILAHINITTSIPKMLTIVKSTIALLASTIITIAILNDHLDPWSLVYGITALWTILGRLQMMMNFLARLQVVGSMERKAGVLGMVLVALGAAVMTISKFESITDIKSVSILVWDLTFILGALGILMYRIATMQVVGNMQTKLIALGASIAAMGAVAYIIYKLSYCPMDDAMKIAGSLTMLLIAITGLYSAIIALPTLGMGIGKIFALGSALLAMLGIVGILYAMQQIINMDSLIACAASLTTLTLSLIGMLVVLSLAGRGGVSVLSIIKVLGSALVGMLGIVGILKLMEKLNPFKMIPSAIALYLILKALNGTLAVLANIKGPRNGLAMIVSVIAALAALGGVVFALNHIGIENTDNLLLKVTAINYMLLGLSVTMAILSLLRIPTNMIVTVISMGLLIGEMIGALKALEYIDLNNIKDAPKIVAAMAIVFIITTGVLAICSLLGPIARTAFPAIIALGIIMVEMVGVLKALEYVDVTGVEGDIKALGLLSLVFYALSGLVLIMGAIGMIAPTIFIGLGTFTAVVILLGALLAALGKIFEDPRVVELMESGVEYMAKIGEMFGALIKGFVSESSKALPVVGAMLSEFMNNAAGFFVGLNVLSNGDPVGAMGKLVAILAMVAATEIETALIGIISLFTEDLSMVGLQSAFNNLIQIAKYIISYSGVTKLLTQADADHISLAAGILKLLLNQQITKSLFDLFVGIFGTNKVDSFGAALENFGESLIKFCRKIKKLKDRDRINTQLAFYIASKMVEVADAVPNEGGLLAAIVGENNVGDFGKSLEDFGDGLYRFAKSCRHLKNNDISYTNIAATMLERMANASYNIPNDTKGSVIGWIVGYSDSLTDFGNDLENFGVAITSFAKSISELTSDDEATSKIAANMLYNMANATKEIGTKGGIVGFIKGNKEDLDLFSKKLPRLGKGLASFANKTHKLNGSHVLSASSAMQILFYAVDMMDKINKRLGGGASTAAYMQGIMTKFGETLIGFAGGLGKFYESVKDVDPDRIDKVASVLTNLVNLATSDFTGLSNLAQVMEDAATQGVENFTNVWVTARSEVVGTINEFVKYVSDTLQEESNLGVIRTAGLKDATEFVKSVGESISAEVKKEDGYLALGVDDMVNNLNYWFMTMDHLQKYRDIGAAIVKEITAVMQQDLEKAVTDAKKKAGMEDGIEITESEYTPSHHYGGPIGNPNESNIPQTESITKGFSLENILEKISNGIQGLGAIIGGGIQSLTSGKPLGETIKGWLGNAKDAMSGFMGNIMGGNFDVNSIVQNMGGGFNDLFGKGFSMESIMNSSEMSKALNWFGDGKNPMGSMQEQMQDAMGGSKMQDMMNGIGGDLGAAMGEGAADELKDNISGESNASKDWLTILKEHSDKIIKSHPELFKTGEDVIYHLMKEENRGAFVNTVKALVGADISQLPAEEIDKYRQQLADLYKDGIKETDKVVERTYKIEGETEATKELTKQTEESTKAIKEATEARDEYINGTKEKNDVEQEGLEIIEEEVKLEERKGIDNSQKIESLTRTKYGNIGDTADETASNMHDVSVEIENTQINTAEIQNKAVEMGNTMQNAVSGVNAITPEINGAIFMTSIAQLLQETQGMIDENKLHPEVVPVLDQNKLYDFTLGYNVLKYGLNGTTDASLMKVDESLPYGPYNNEQYKAYDDKNMIAAVDLLNQRMLELQKQVTNYNVYLDKEVLVGQMAPAINKQFGIDARRGARA